MRVFVDGEPVDLVPGASVRHALLARGRASGREGQPRVFDPWDNEVGLDGELSEGDRLYTLSRQGTPGRCTELA